MSIIENFTLPAHFGLEFELREQLSGRPGHQRCIEGAGELLLVVHDVPKPGVAERDALFFWKRHDGTWMQPSGPGNDELDQLLDHYAKTIDEYEELINETEGPSQLLRVLRHSGPMARSTRNMVGAFEQVVRADPDDRGMRRLCDRAREIERAAELLHMDARMMLDFSRAESAEKQAKSSARLNEIAFRLNLLAGFFLPLVALGGLFGMNVNLPGFVKSLFWLILFGGLIIGGAVVWFVGWQASRLSGDDDDAGD
jgi:hypothetical protein